MYILKFLHFAKPNRPKRISDMTYLSLSGDEASHYTREIDNTEFAPASTTAVDDSSVTGSLYDFQNFSDTPCNDPSPAVDVPEFNGFGGGDFGGAGSSGSWGDDTPSSEPDTSYDSGSNDSGSGSDSD